VPLASKKNIHKQTELLFYEISFNSTAPSTNFYFHRSLAEPGTTSKKHVRRASKISVGRGPKPTAIAEGIYRYRWTMASASEAHLTPACPISRALTYGLPPKTG
jgi:hypothetical protein